LAHCALVLQHVGLRAGSHLEDRGALRSSAHLPTPHEPPLVTTAVVFRPLHDCPEPTFNTTAHMRRLIATMLFACAVIVVPATVHAQYAVSQDSTLAGIKKVYLNFTDGNGGLGVAEAEELTGQVALELRKAGIRVAKERSELTGDDAILNVSVVTVTRTLVTDVQTRIDVEQMAQLARTKKSYAMVTWFYEQNKLNGIPKVDGPRLVKAGLDDFLSKWLDMNGR
jgi:hypothetical protein